MLRYLWINLIVFLDSQKKGYLADGKPDITTEGDLASHK